MVVAVTFLATATRDRLGGLGGIFFNFIAFPRPARAMDDAAARLKSSPGCLDQDLRRPTGPRSRAKIILDLWLMSVGPFYEVVGAAIFQGNIYRTVLFGLSLTDPLVKPVTAAIF
jgi:hypothetical protein